MKIADLKAALSELQGKAKAIIDGCKAMGRDADDDQLAALEDLKAKIDAKKEEIQAAEEKQERLAALAAAVAPADVEANEPDDTPVVANVRQVSEDDPKAGFAHGGQFLMAVKRAETHGEIDPRLGPLAAVGSDENRSNSNPLGGFLVPEGFSPNLLSTETDADFTAGRVTEVPMEAPRVKIPSLADKNHTNSVSSGWRFYYGNQASEKTSSKGEFKQVILDASTMTALAYVTDEQMMDSAISFASILEGAFAKEAASFILDKKINGTGTGEPEGILNAACKITQAAESGQGANTITGTNLVKMRSRAYRYGSNYMWVANYDTYPQLAAAHIPGTNGDVSVWQESLVPDRPSTLLGAPVNFTEYCPALGSEGDIILVDWSQYLWGVYMAAQGASSMHVRFTSNEQAFKVNARNDGRCWWDSAITVKRGSQSIGPIITLNATRT